MSVKSFNLASSFTGDKPFGTDNEGMKAIG